MINKIMGLGVTKAAQTAGKVAKDGANKVPRLTRVLQNEGLGKVLEVAADNQNVCQAGFALGICCVMRPATNLVVTEDKKDAWFANAHSISSGGIGFIWPLVVATPLAVGVKRILAKPQKYLRPELIKKFYPNVAVADKLGKNGEKIGEKIVTNTNGDMLRKDGSVLMKDLEPLMIYKEAERPAFEAANPNLYVDNAGVVRSRTVFKTENGVYKKDKDGNKIGVAVQKDLNPITEEMEIGALKEKNVQTFINMSADILLAPIRASLTIMLIPSILGALGIEKRKKPEAAAAAQAEAAKPALNVVSTTNNTVNKVGASNASVFSAFKKGGV